MHFGGFIQVQFQLEEWMDGFVLVPCTLVWILALKRSRLNHDGEGKLNADMGMDGTRSSVSSNTQTQTNEV